MDKIRKITLEINRIEDDKHIPIFVNFKGTAQMDNVAAGINTLFRAVGVKFRVTPTIIRHAAATTSFNNAALEQWGNVIHHMKHSSATHKKYYVDENSAKHAARSGKLIQKLLRGRRLRLHRICCKTTCAN